MMVLLFLGVLCSCSVQKRRYLKGFHVERPGLAATTKSHNRNPHLKKLQPISVKVSVDSTQGVVATASPDRRELNLSDKTVNPLIRIQPDTNRKKQKSVSDAGKWGRSSIVKALQKNDQKKTIQNEEDNRDASKRRLAIIIGISLVLMAILAGLTVPALSGLFVAGDAALTALNVMSDFGKYITGVIGWIGILVLDIAVSLGIYKYYKKERPRQAALTGGLRLAYSAILGVGIANLLMVTKTSSAASVFHHFSMFNTIWGLGLIVFGCHLISLGILFKNEGGKKWLNTVIRVLLIIAGIGYIVQYLGMLLVANPLAYAAVVQPLFLIPMILCEIAYAIWKIVKGGKTSINTP